MSTCILKWEHQPLEPLARHVCECKPSRRMSNVCQIVGIIVEHGYNGLTTPEIGQASVCAWIYNKHSRNWPAFKTSPYCWNVKLEFPLPC